MPTIMVKCTLLVPVEIPEDPEYNADFDIEENHCPGTGLVGMAIDAVMKKASEGGWCWACHLHGTNEIVG